MIIVGVDFRDATTATLKEVNTAMNVYGRRKNVRTKRMKQLIAILLAVTMITLSTAKPYQEAKATGLEGGLIAGGAGAAMSNPVGWLILMGIVGGAVMLFPPLNDVQEAGRKGEIEKVGKKMKEDFVNYSTQALNNNVSAAEQQRDNAAHARSVIEDFLESASAGVIDTTSEAWQWAKDFVSDIKNALGGGSSNTMNGVAGLNLDGEYIKAVELNPKRSEVRYQSLSIEFKGLDLSSITSNKCVMALSVNSVYANLVVGEIWSDGSIHRLDQSLVKNLGAKYRIITDDGVGVWNNFTGVYSYSLGNSAYFDPVFNLPLIDATYAAPSGTTDVPGVSNVNDYTSIGSDLPYTRPEGAWDICDPNGKQGQVSIGNDIPGKMGYDDWYDLLGGINAGHATWEDVANASDVIHIGSDTDSPYSRDDAGAWDAYLDGTIIGYDVNAEGNITITMEGGRVITIPQEYADSIEFTNEQDQAQELDKDTVLPVAGVISYPLPAAIEADPPADPNDPGGGGGNVKVDSDVSDYTLDFRKLFPFCIPFDIYKAVKLLDATPVAPVVHYKFYYTKSKTYTIDLNLNKFNTVAAILRRMECLLFIIGLATATRRVYIRG